MSQESSKPEASSDTEEEKNETCTMDEYFNNKFKKEKLSE
jgi:hypothetical protein